MKRILIIDRLFSLILPRKIKSKHIKICCENDLVGALKETKKHNYDLIVCEFDFLTQDNKEILEEQEEVEIMSGRERIIFNFIKKTSCNVILCSGYSQLDIVSKLTELHIEDRVKPIQVPVSAEKIELEIRDFLE